MLTDRKDTVIICNLYTQKWLISLSIAIQDGPQILWSPVQGTLNSSEVGCSLSHGQFLEPFVSNVASEPVC